MFHGIGMYKYKDGSIYEGFVCSFVAVIIVINSSKGTGTKELASVTDTYGRLRYSSLFVVVFILSSIGLDLRGLLRHEQVKYFKVK